jgi:hypothetical protein
LTAFGFEHEPTEAALQRLLQTDHITIGPGTPRSLILPPEMLASDPGSLAPARAPPQLDFDDAAD